MRICTTTAFCVISVLGVSASCATDPPVGSSETQANRTGEPITQAARSQTALEVDGSKATLPDDIVYTIVGSDVVPGKKRSLDIRLNQKVTSEVLRSIARTLKDQDQGEYERTFICYYLPDMKVGAAAWATTHFTPDLDVQILGLTTEESEKLLDATEPPSKEILGRWLDDSPIIGSAITLYREKKRLFLQTRYKDGSESIVEVKRTQTTRGERLVDKQGNSFGEHYVIDKQGNLQIRDQDGLIATAKAVK